MTCLQSSMHKKGAVYRCRKSSDTKATMSAAAATATATAATAAANNMLRLKTQAEFEKMWFLDPTTGPRAGMRAIDCGWIQYHTASWCGPCKRLATNEIVEAAKNRGLTVWKIDVDENEYTSGYCGVRSVPTFQFCVPRKIVAELQNSRTDTVVEWINQL